jgi:hypothetical protein
LSLRSSVRRPRAALRFICRSESESASDKKTLCCSITSYKPGGKSVRWVSQNSGEAMGWEFGNRQP